MIQERFVELVRTGAKTQTIRQTARCEPGDTLSIRRWTGKPYRSKQELVYTAKCVNVMPVTIGEGGFVSHFSDNVMLVASPKADGFARADGFKSAEEMIGWFRDTHGLPFKGFIIHWDWHKTYDLTTMAGKKACLKALEE